MVRFSRIPTCVCAIVATLAASVAPVESFAGGLLDSVRSKTKGDILDLVQEGAPDKKVLSAIENLERLSLGQARLSSPNLPGNWLMIWTTSDSIAGKSRLSFLQTTTPPEQLIDIENGRAINAERVLGIRNAVQAELTPATNNKVRVQFKKFQIGPLAFTAPENLRGELSVTYLDDDMRISRGDQGNAFILLRESSKRKEADETWKKWRTTWNDDK